MFKSLFRPKVVEREALELYAKAVDQARLPSFYTDLGVADRIDARFELYTLHVLLLFVRLRHENTRSAELAQKLFDHYISSLDNALRELGVGDVSVGKKMRKLGEAVYGRMSSYEKALTDNDVDSLKIALARNVFESEDAEKAAKLADYTAESHKLLSEQTIAEVEAAPNWAKIVK